MAQNHIETGHGDWIRSDEYHNGFLIKPDEDLEFCQEESKRAGLKDIAVSEAQGKFLHLIAKSIGAKRILEVGTLGGYSTIWLSKALPEGGHLTTLDIDPNSTKTAGKNIERAGLSSKVELIQGPAVETIKTLRADPPFDLVFIDADKQSNLEYFIEAKRLVRQLGVIIVDNVVRWGRVSNPEYTDERVEGVRRLLQHLKSDTDVECTTISTVGTKGYDGFIYAIKL